MDLGERSDAGPEVLEVDEVLDLVDPLRLLPPLLATELAEDGAVLCDLPLCAGAVDGLFMCAGAITVLGAVIRWLNRGLLVGSNPDGFEGLLALGIRLHQQHGRHC